MKAISKRVSWEIAKEAFIPAAALITLVAGYVFYQVKLEPSISPELARGLKKYIGTFFIIFVAFVIHRISGAVFAWYKENIAAKTKTRLDDRMIPLMRRTSKVIIWSIAFVVILPLYGVNISALIATLGVGSLAIALAAQDTIANVISGFMIMIDTPFEIGDRIKLPSGEVVKVIDIGIRRSSFLSDENAVITVPNVDLSKNKIINYTRGQTL